MKSILLGLLLLLASLDLYAQKPAFLGLQVDYTFTGEGHQPAAGINLEAYLGKHFSINYSVLYGPIDSDQYYFYTGGGQALGVHLIGNAFGENGGGALGISLGVFSFVLPESIAFRVRLINKFQVAVFYAPYGYELIKNTKNEERDQRVSYELGLRFYLDIKDWMQLVPRIGVKQMYGEQEYGGAYGVALMFNVDKS